MKTLPILVCLILPLLSQPSLADSTISIISDQGQSTILVRNGRLLIRSTDPENAAIIQNRTISEAIFDTKEETFYAIDHQQKSVSPVTRATMEQLASTLNAAVGVLDSIPEEQRDTLSGFMKGLGMDLPVKQVTPEVELIPLTSQEFRGIRCEENQVFEGNQEIGKLCVTQGNSTPLSDDDYQTLLSAQTFFLSMAKHATPFAEQYGQTVPNLDGIQLDGLIVNSAQTQNNNNDQNANFTVSAIDTNALQDINLPEGYQIEPLF